jgi:Iron-containing redox enzyme
MHATLFAGTMRHLGLDDTYGAYVHRLPGSTLATVNLVSMFALHRRLRGAAVGHLAVFEMTSVVPMGRYAAALTRLGLPEAARRFYDVHVIADAEHELIALDRMVYAIERDDPGIALDVLFGARAVLEIERRFAEALLAAWQEGESSLRGWRNATGERRQPMASAGDRGVS